MLGVDFRSGVISRLKIAVLSRSVNAALPELSANVLPGKDFGASGGDGRTDRDRSSFGHGTAMASIMVATPGEAGITGLAPDAKILPIAVPIQGTTDYAGDDHLPDAITWAADHGAKIISMSLGGDRSQATDSLACPTDEQNAISHAIAKGAIVVASAGNGGQKGNLPEDPGVCIGVVSVGALTAQSTVASFSSRERYLTLSAPGVQVASLSRIAGTAFSGDGTSQAAALTSAGLALVWSAHPTLDARQIVARTLYTLDGRTTDRSVEYGYGRLDVARAVTADVPASAPNPVYDAVQPYLRILGSPQAAVPSASPAATEPAAPGMFQVGSRPSTVTGRMVAGIVIAAVGVLAVLIALALTIGTRRGARVRPAPEPPAPTAPPPDLDALAWQVIPAPEPGPHRPPQ